MRRHQPTSCLFLSGLSLLLASPPARASAPINKLPGVVDADQWNQTNHPHKAAPPPAPIPQSLARSKELIDTLNQLPEAQLTEKSGPAILAIQNLRAEDGPDFSKTRALLARADVRKPLNAGTKGILADLLSPRWDAFNLAGNLWLGALQSTNPDITSKARQDLPHFVQPAHVPVLIHLLKVSGPNVLAYDVLQDVTGQKLDPSALSWESWWKRVHGKCDVVGHMLNVSRNQIKDAQIKPIDPASFWYAPEEVGRMDKPFAKRSSSEQEAIGRWSDAARTDVKRYLDQWDLAKPLLEKIVHQPDARVGGYLRTLLNDPGMGEYMAVVLAWRGDQTARKTIEAASQTDPTTGRLLALGSLGEKTVLRSLLARAEQYKAPVAYPLMDDELRGYAAKLASLGMISAEQAFELLAHQRMALVTATTPKEKKKAIAEAKAWLDDHFEFLQLDKKHGYYVNANANH